MAGVKCAKLAGKDHGEHGDDFLDGGEGKDLLFGTQGADTLLGGSGDDVISGGKGPDVFEFAFGNRIDFIEDFEIGIGLFHLADEYSIRIDLEFVRKPDGLGGQYSSSDSVPPQGVYRTLRQTALNSCEDALSVLALLKQSCQ